MASELTILYILLLLLTPQVKVLTEGLCVSPNAFVVNLDALGVGYEDLKLSDFRGTLRTKYKDTTSVDDLARV